jgi:dynein heavy chain
LAQRLVIALGSEKERWAKSIIRLNSQLDLIVGDVVMASSFVSYAGIFNKKYRIIMNEDFMKFIKENHIPVSPDPNPVKILTPESVIALWSKQ